MKTNLVFSYKPLWKLLIDRDLNKTQLQELSGISAATMAKLGKGGNVTTEVLARICETLECDIADICELVRASEPEA
ncbi:DNA-binding Xre family transcriptional regulator [Arcanobacterium wilhelmae]|uniref:DNA-binding Xre family transcriptional regulator n=1 Tax=Arcanobacterium wilhelmae TaxID=1803177 RepID=A0ABT9N8Q5_9ACTO|nr:helix-turn-helix transcriptional regulator [Arcanobacterium wilhelmae]MDP9800084.1 DNA-binding Xre family transcriptional regulator [Arcanobacterium wilhelmae]